MASGIFMIFDDIAMLMDDMALATKKTAGILGDDLAVNADKASGFSASRELPVLWEITKGSFLNKLIILPMVFLMSAFAPWLIVPILMFGGVYLAYEGAEKIYEYFRKPQQELPLNRYAEMSIEKLKDDEADKIKSAITTDFILSIEIIIIALGAVLDKNIFTQISVVSFVAVIATIGVYGIVAIIVRMDDFGYMLVNMSNGTDNIKKKMGEFLITLLPKVIKSLTVVGTIAMLLVAGGIYVHNIHELHEFLHGIPSIIGDFLVGSIVGFIALIIVKTVSKIKR